MKGRFVLVLGLFTALVATSPASAYLDTTCQLGIGVAVCQPRTTNPDARIIIMQPVVDEDVTDADRQGWTNRCKPRKVFDGLKMVWLYAESGCWIGPLPGDAAVNDVPLPRPRPR